MNAPDDVRRAMADDAALTPAVKRRLAAARSTPYDGGIWEGKKFCRKPFVTIRAEDYDALTRAVFA